MNKAIRKSITWTTITSGKVDMSSGTPVVTPNEPVTVLGDLTDLQVDSLVKETYNLGNVVFEVTKESKKYKWDIESILEYGTIIENESKSDEQTAVEEV